MGCGVVGGVGCALFVLATMQCHIQAQFLGRYGGGGGGSRSFAESDSVSRGVNIGNLGISSTLTNARAASNKGYSQGLSHGLGLGPLGIGTSLSSDRRGVGLQRTANGGVGVGVGPLGFDLYRNMGVRAQTSAGAHGAQTASETDSQSYGQNLGLLGLSGARSRSRAEGIGQNSGAYSTGLGTSAGRPYYGRRRRRSTSFSEQNGVKDSKQSSVVKNSSQSENDAVETIELKDQTSKVLDQNQFEKMISFGSPEERTFNGFFDTIFRIIFHTPSPVLGPDPQLQGCCFTCNVNTYMGMNPCQQGPVGGYPIQGPPILQNQGPPLVQNQGLFGFSSSSSTNNMGNGGPFTLYSYSNSQSGVQAG